MSTRNKRIDATLALAPIVQGVRAYHTWNRTKHSKNRADLKIAIYSQHLTRNGST
ncbi:MAG: hypothetical protein Q4A31_06315 [Corynebacterium sp.]|uniref:hypothetical protein n=1 Tax=Corynebacterium sp. TaxID=1720 RepID=UPI0026DB0EA9|nr:hypothetical protein [Corynebacterium sp.]MDO4761511.1 hypothetical protein [Corynebacterium sp.]